MRTFALFIATALAEIVGCYLPYLWLKQGRSAWLLVPAAASLALFAWLLTLHETAAGRVYAAYGGVYIGVAADGMGRGGRRRRADRHGPHHVSAALINSSMPQRAASLPVCAWPAPG